jgi:hypothetical protein
MTTTKDEVAQADIDAEIVAVVASARTRLLAGEHVDPDGLTEKLRSLSPDMADLVGRDLAQRLTSGVGPTQLLKARHVAAQLGDVFTAVVNDRGDRSGVVAAEHTEQEVQARLRATQDELERASAVADLDAVLRLRPLVEVALPSEVERAQLGRFDAQIAYLQSITSNSQTLTAACDAEVQARTARVRAAEQALQAATSALAAATGNQASLSQVTSIAAMQARVAQTDRDELATQIKANEQRRFRRLAGLDVDDATTDNATPATPAQSPTPIARITGGFTRTIDQTPYRPSQTIGVIHEPVVATRSVDPGNPSIDNVAKLAVHLPNHGDVLR